jgi:hypothetical protein
MLWPSTQPRATSASHSGSKGQIPHSKTELSQWLGGKRPKVEDQNLSIYALVSSKEFKTLYSDWLSGIATEGLPEWAGSSPAHSIGAGFLVPNLAIPDLVFVFSRKSNGQRVECRGPAVIVTGREPASKHVARPGFGTRDTQLQACALSQYLRKFLVAQIQNAVVGQNA